MTTTIKKYWTHLFLLIVILILGLLSYQQGGWDLVANGFMSGIRILWRELPLLSAAFLTAGFLQGLIKKETINRWLGTESGIKGILLACLGGGLIPGGPYAYYPIANALMKSGAGLGVLIAFVSAKNLWSVSRIPLEIAILGPSITIRRYLLTFLIPPLLGYITQKLFSSINWSNQENVES